MIRSFRHPGLKRLYERGDPGRIGADLAERVAVALADLDEAGKPSDLKLPGYRLHPLKGNLKGFLEYLDYRQLANHLPFRRR